MLATLLAVGHLAQETVSDSGLIDDSVTQVDVSLLAMLGGFVIPIVTAIATKQLAASWVKAVTTAVLAVLAGLVATAIETSGRVDWEIWATGIIQAAMVAWASYYGFWKPTVAPKIQAATGNFGLGGSSPAPAE